MPNPFYEYKQFYIKQISLALVHRLVLFDPIGRTLSGATTVDQCGPESDGNKGVLRIPQSSSITGAAPSDCLVSYLGHSLRETYPSAELQSVHFTAPVDWARLVCHMNNKQVSGVFCYIAWIRVVFSFYWDTLFKFVSFISTCLMVSASSIPE